MAQPGEPRISGRLALKRRAREVDGSKDEQADFVDPFNIEKDNGGDSTEDTRSPALIKRGRGRPPKHSYAMFSKENAPETPAQVPMDDGDKPPMVHIVTVASSSRKSKRGRPRKHFPPSLSTAGSGDGSGKKSQRRHGEELQSNLIETAMVSSGISSEQVELTHTVTPDATTGADIQPTEQVAPSQHGPETVHPETSSQRVQPVFPEGGSDASEQTKAPSLASISRLPSIQQPSDNKNEIFSSAVAPLSLKCLDTWNSSQMKTWNKLLDDNKIVLEEQDGNIYATGSIEALYRVQNAIKKMRDQDSDPADVKPDIGGSEEEEDGGVGESDDSDYKVRPTAKRRTYKRRSKCNICGFLSSAEGLKRHKWRMHPEKSLPCEVCGLAFGMEYDKRRHRLTHFDATGKLTTKGQELLKQYDPARTELSLGDLEEKFEPVDGDLLLPNAETKEKNQPTETAVEETSTEMTDDCKEENNTDAVANDMIFSVPVGNSEDVPNEKEEAPADVTEPKTTLQRSEGSASVGNNLNVAAVKNTKVECGLCGTRVTLSAIRYHRQFHPKLLYMCPHTGCSAAEPKLKVLEMHYKKKHPSDDPTKKFDSKALACRCGESECDFRGGAEEVLAHSDARHRLRLVCTECGAEHDTEAEIRLHHLKEHAEQPASMDKVKLRLPPRKQGEVYVCETCGRSFQHVMHYKKHMASHQSAVYRCELCPFQSDRLGIVNNHIRQKHAQVEETTCVHCNKVFATPATLLYHIQTVHDKTAAFSCDECAKTFTCRKYLQVHKSRTHLKKLNHFCNHCGKGFFEKLRRDEHEQIHATGEAKEALKVHTCSYCGKRYARRIQLLQHENTHTGKRPFVCKVCGKGFAYSAEVSKHMMTHRDERPYVCSFCGKGFKFSYKLKAHLTIHTKQGRHRCEKCGKVFTALSTLRKHVCKASAPGTDTSTTKLVFATSNSDQARHLQSVIVDQERLVTLEDTEVVENALHIMAVNENKDLIIQKVLNIANQSEEEEPGFELTTPTEEPVVLEHESVIHVEAEPEGDTSVLYMCGICNSMFPSEEEVNDHMTEHNVVTMVMKDDEGEPQLQDDQFEQIVLTHGEPGGEEEITGGDIAEDLIAVHGESAQEIIVKSEDVEGAAIALTHLLG